MSTPATPTDVLQGPCPTKPIALTLPLAAIEQLEQLAESQHISRQALLGLIVKAALLRDTPWWREGEDAIDRLADQAYRHQGYGRLRRPGNPNSEGRSAPDCPSEALWRSGGSAVRPARVAERLSVVADVLFALILGWTPVEVSRDVSPVDQARAAAGDVSRPHAPGKPSGLGSTVRLGA